MEPIFSYSRRATKSKFLSPIVRAGGLNDRLKLTLLRKKQNVPFSSPGITRGFVSSHYMGLPNIRKNSREGVQ
jgi:hypothetical protein